MSDQFFNRDRNRPYDEDDDEDFYNRDFRSRMRSDRDFDESSDYGVSGRTYGQNYGRGQSYGYGQNYGRGQNIGRGSARYGGGYNRGYGGDYERGFDEGSMGSDFDTDYDRWYRGRYGSEYGGYGRGQGFNRSYGRGGYSSGYSRDFGYGERTGRGYGQGFDRDEMYDYDFDNMPTTWSYSEIWLIPGPFTGIGPEDYQRSDDRIREDVNERLTQHGRLNARNIQVQVNNGEVTLTGTVDNRQAKRMAEDVVESISGVREVHNQIRIQERQQMQGQQQSQMQGSTQQQGQKQGQGQRTRSGQRS